MLLVNSVRCDQETINVTKRRDGHEPHGVLSITSSCVCGPYPEIDCQPFLSPRETNLVPYHGIGGLSVRR